MDERAPFFSSSVPLFNYWHGFFPFGIRLSLGPLPKPFFQCLGLAHLRFSETGVLPFLMGLGVPPALYFPEGRCFLPLSSKQKHSPHRFLFFLYFPGRPGSLLCSAVFRPPDDVFFEEFFLPFCVADLRFRIFYRQPTIFYSLGS